MIFFMLLVLLSTSFVSAEEANIVSVDAPEEIIYNEDYDSRALSNADWLSHDQRRVYTSAYDGDLYFITVRIENIDYYVYDHPNYRLSDVFFEVWVFWIDENGNKLYFPDMREEYGSPAGYSRRLYPELNQTKTTTILIQKIPDDSYTNVSLRVELIWSDEGNLGYSYHPLPYTVADVWEQPVEFIVPEEEPLWNYPLLVVGGLIVLLLILVIIRSRKP